MTLSKNPWYCADIIRAAKPDFTPRVAFILGSGLGALADQIDDAVSLSYEKLPGFPVSTVHGHAGELVLGHRFVGQRMVLTADQVEAHLDAVRRAQALARQGFRVILPGQQRQGDREARLRAILKQARQRAEGVDDEG